ATRITKSTIAAPSVPIGSRVSSRRLRAQALRFAAGAGAASALGAATPILSLRSTIAALEATLTAKAPRYAKSATNQWNHEGTKTRRSGSLAGFVLVGVLVSWCLGGFVFYSSWRSWRSWRFATQA